MANDQVIAYDWAVHLGRGYGPCEAWVRVPQLNEEMLYHLFVQIRDNHLELVVEQANWPPGSRGKPLNMGFVFLRPLVAEEIEVLYKNLEKSCRERRLVTSRIRNVVGWFRSHGRDPDPYRIC